MHIRQWFVLPLLFALTVGADSVPVGCSPALAWSGNTHRKLTSDALRLMPSRFLTRFGPFRRDFMRGSTIPDSHLKDFRNHVFHVRSSQPQEAAEFCRNAFAELVMAARNGLGERDLAFRLGVFSHYVADWNQPLHTAGSETDPRESDYHLPFERDVETLLSSFPVGRPPSGICADPVGRLREMAAVARAEYEAIGQAYRHGNGLIDTQEIVERRYRAAAGAIRDFWIAIFREAGQHQLVEDLPLPESAAFLPAATALPSTPQRIDLNQASFEQLQTLPGIGPAKARAIITARPFRSPYDLGRVRGFGWSGVERLLEKVFVAPRSPGGSPKGKKTSGDPQLMQTPG